MNPFKKALFVVFGCILIGLGIGTMVIFVLATNIELDNKVLGTSSGLFVTIFGWWLLRRGSNSVWEAIGWLLGHIIP